MPTTISPATLPLVLASASPYRQALLQRLGLPFTVDAAGIDEAPRAGESPAQTAVRLAEGKARAVAGRHPAALIIGSDQIADVRGVAVGKPRDRADALEQLRMLRGRTVIFHTAVALLNSKAGSCRTALVDVVSSFRSLDDATLETYLDRERPSTARARSRRKGSASRSSPGSPATIRPRSSACR